MAEPKKNNRFDNIIKDLSGENDKKVFTALKQLRKHGKKEAVIPLIDLLSTTTNDDIKTDVTSLLFDLKDQTVVEELIKAIQSDDYIAEKPILISIFWQSSLDSSEHITTIVGEAIKGDYMVGIEVLSVLDNYDTTFQETEIEDLKFDLEEAIEMDDSEKKNLLISIRSAIDSLNLEF
jgi:hypothetical protein